MRRRGFSLLELVLVMVIMGVIAALAVPRAGYAQQRARYTATWAGFSRFEAGLHAYRSVYRAYPPDSLNAAAPAGMSDFVPLRHWQAQSPIGGQWDWNNTFYPDDTPNSLWQPIGANMSIRRIPPDVTIYARFALLDQMFDDGLNNSGRLRRLATQYAGVLLEP